MSRRHHQGGIALASQVIAIISIIIILAWLVLKYHALTLSGVWTWNIININIIMIFLWRWRLNCLLVLTWALPVLLASPFYFYFGIVVNVIVVLNRVNGVKSYHTFPIA